MYKRNLKNIIWHSNSSLRVVIQIKHKMNNFKTLSVFILLAIVTCNHAASVPPAEEKITDLPVTIVAVGPNIMESHDTCKIQFYHPSQDSWTTLADLDLPVFDDYSTIVSQGKLYFFGGKKSLEDTGTDEVSSFDLATKEIKQLKPMGEKKRLMSVAEIGDYIYITGGIGEEDKFLDTVERYHPKTDSWSVMAPMHTKRYFHAINVHEGKMYVAGGIGHNSPDYLKSLEIYDPNLNKWTLGTPMNHPRYQFSIVFVDGSIFALGGIYSLKSDDTDGERLDLNTQKWEYFKNPIKDSTWRSATVLDDMIYIHGAGDNNYKYNAKTNEMKKLKSNDHAAPNFLLASTS
ncbi:kelch-like protein 36 [Arctopsyche grandis]|uniref:kelch-like protein 36 n=1 Tax=Arctopsyche grandis TaxID=121162 RepID=UPI00406D6BAF